tara:strand:+ start:1325 stop:2293 length:969 start_codon:yes stop_codon:yes gene_type:complete
MYNVDYKIWKKIQDYAHSAHDLFNGAEIGGMAIMEEKEKGEWWLIDPVILKQTVSGGSTSLDQEELAHYYTEVAMKRKNNPLRYRFLWWHSHHTMGAFWSGTDDKAIEEMSDGDFSFALVVSWKSDPNEHILRVSYWDPEEAHVDTEFDIYNQPEKKIAKSIVKEVTEKCSKPESRTVMTLSSGGWKGYNVNRTPLGGSAIDWRQQSIFENRDKLPATYNKLTKNNIHGTEFTSRSDVYDTIKEMVQKNNASLLEKTISFDLYLSEIEDIELLATQYDYEIIKPYDVETAIKWIKSKKTDDWIEFDYDSASYNASYGLGGWE